MNITQIRNATQHITFGGKTFLIDPMLADKGTYPGFAGTARAEIRNPTVDLPVDIDTLLNVDALIVTHLHEDHWDEAAARVVPRDKPIYVQNDRDAQVLREQGFTKLTVLTQNTALGDITLRKTGGQHGSAVNVAPLAIHAWWPGEFKPHHRLPCHFHVMSGGGGT